ncbi:hypothetical protein BJV74DRAFT_871268 [Russula compacta]|nr:hypothetical protein BJV74DRAFT_871268 [Russula compacta]
MPYHMRQPKQHNRAVLPNPVSNIHEPYLPPRFPMICPPESHQTPSLGSYALICPQGTHQPQSLGSPDPHRMSLQFSSLPASCAMTHL